MPGSLDDIMLLHLKDSVPCFAPPGPSVPKKKEHTEPATTEPTSADTSQFMENVLLHVQMIDGCLVCLEQLTRQLADGIEELAQSIARMVKDAPGLRNRLCL